MDVFLIDSTSISSTMIDPETTIIDEITEVKFETHSEFDLNFFDTPDDSMTQTAFSSPNSVDSSASPTPEPLMPLTPSVQQITSSNMTINQQHHQNMTQPTMVIIKQGKATDCDWTLSALNRETRTAFYASRKFTSLCSCFKNCITIAEFSFRWDSGFAVARESLAIINYDNNIIAFDSLKARHQRAPQMGINK